MAKNKVIVRNTVCAAISALVMLLLPLCTVTFFKGVNGMAACIYLLFAVNPIAAVCVGVFSGLNMRVSWFQPLLLAVLFVIGAWIFLDAGETAFLLYGMLYLLLSYAAALITLLIRHKRKRASM